MDDPELARLIRTAQTGDAAAFGELVDLHYDLMHRFAWKWCGHRTDAEDIAQQACLKLARSLAQFRFESAFRSWLYRLVVSCAQDWQRANVRHAHTALPDDVIAFDSGRADDAVLLTQLLDQLEMLGEGMRETALLVHAEGLSHAEAGRVLGVSESTISWRIHMMRKQVNQHLSIAGGSV